MNKSESIKNLAAALSKAQAKMHGALKDSDNPFFKSKYADLESVWHACREALTDNGLSVTQVMGHGPALTTTLMHSSGEWIEGTQDVMAKSNSPQDLGSAITYARRYGLAAIAGVAQTDDDAEAAHGRHHNREVPVATPQPSNMAKATKEKLKAQETKTKFNMESEMKTPESKTPEVKAIDQNDTPFSDPKDSPPPFKRPADSPPSPLGSKINAIVQDLSASKNLSDLAKVWQNNRDNLSELSEEEFFRAEQVKNTLKSQFSSMAAQGGF